MKVGFQRTNDYNVRRNIADLVEDIDYVRVYDAYEIFGKFCKLAAAVVQPADLDLQDLRGAYFDFSINRVDLLHFFNVVSFCKTPWISTFETTLPRYRRALACHHGRQPNYAPLKSDKKIRRALDALSNPSCKRIIALSECTAAIQRKMLSEFPEYNEAVSRKLLVLHPPQPAYFDNYACKRLSDSDPIRFIFVGRSFFRKGGMQMLDAFQQIKEEGYQLTLTIISSLAIDNYATQETPADVELAKKVIYENREWIVHHHSLPNHKTVELIKASHVGLLPTYADTFGYSVLEFQGCGCPVITTDVRALPEVNDNAAGWVIRLPKNTLGEAIYSTEQDRAEIAKKITCGVADVVRDIFRRRSDIQLKADVALERIRLKHAPDRFAERLREIYWSAVDVSQ
jgi:glycosyltransferase involved in cell wall biosynthesis